MYDLKEMLNNIIQEDEEIQLNLKDLVWAILVYQHRLHQKEQELFDALDGRKYGDIQWLRTEKECYASRCDEIARIIGQYSDFDTQRIWEQTREIHKQTKTYGR